MTRTRLRCVLFASLLALSAQTARAQDPSFGDDGFAFAGFADLLLNFSSAEAVAVQGDGKIVVAGGARRSGLDFSDTAIVVARFNADGTLDTSFGNSAGRVVIGFNNRDFAAGVAVLPDGKILVGGSTAASSTGPVSVVLARLTPAGQLDLTFGVSGRVIREVGAVAIFSMKVLGNGRIL